MESEGGLRPIRAPPDTKSPVHVDAPRYHEDTLRYFVEKTELGVLDKEQMAVIALIAAWRTVGLRLYGVEKFFDRQTELSSGFEGKGRVQVKEVITAGSFPMSLLFPEEKTGLLAGVGDFFKRLMGRGNAPPPQRGMT
jgi:hypothetical protein